MHEGIVYCKYIKNSVEVLEHGAEIEVGFNYVHA